MAYRTPAQIKSFLDGNMHRMDGPYQWLGDEPNSYQRDWDKSSVKSCIFANWAYEQAAGNQAIPLVYKTINDADESFLCDRSYFYATQRDLKMFEKAGVPQFGIESQHQLMDFDVIGTSISYPVLAINFVKQLMMSDIPPTWKERHAEPERWPFVMVGGQVYGAPEAAAVIADMVFCGEVEDESDNPGLGAVFKRIETFKQHNLWQTARLDCYERLAVEFNFLYFPCFVDVHYGYEDRPSVANSVRQLYGEREVQASKQVIGYTSKIPAMRLPIVKRFVKNMDSVEGLTNPPLLFVDPGLGSGDAEASRGCPAWCSFCALTYRQKPYRQRSPEYMVNFSQELLKNTGAIHISPFGPDFPMHTQKKRLIRDILENVSDDVDASSMRVDDFIADPSYILLQAHGGMDTVTLGVEGNSQRMRDFVGKGASDASIKEAVAKGIAAGLRKFKLYMIASLPGEDNNDVYRILSLAKDLADIRDSMGSTARLQFSWTPMLIEGNTPFQWFAPTSSNYALGDVWEELRALKVDFKLGGKAQQDKVTFYQLTQRASREVGEALVAAARQFNVGCWGGAPKRLHAVIEEQLVKHGFLNGLADCYDERIKQDMFGWEHIDQGINHELLWQTYQQMVEFLESTDSETYDEYFTEDYQGNEWIQRCDSACLGKTCGVCDAKDLKLRRNYIQGAANEVDIDLNNVKVIDQRTIVLKVRMRVEKSADKRFVPNDHYRYALRRAANRAGFPHTKRTWRIASDSIKFRDFTCGADYVECGLTERVSQAQLPLYVAAMNAELQGMTITDFVTVAAHADNLRQDMDLSLFEMEMDVSPTQTLKAIEDWKKADYVPMIFRKAGQLGIVREEVNGKDYVDDLWLTKDRHHLKIKMLIRGKANPYIVYAALFNRPSWIEAAGYPAVRVEAFVEHDASVVDSFRPLCTECGKAVPISLLDRPFHPDYCPQCKDAVEGTVVGSTALTE